MLETQQDKKTYNPDFFTVLSNRRRLLAQLKYIDNSEQLHTLRNIFDEIVNERLEVIAEIEAEAARKLEKIENLKNIMKEQGISLSELLGEDVDKIKVKSKINRVTTPDGRTMDASLPIRYKFPNSDGQECPWHGSGRLPNRLKELIAEGRTLEEFRIN